MRWLIVALVLTGCAYQPEVTVTLGPKRVEHVTEIGATLTIAQRFGRHGVCEYNHGSDPQHGSPLNNSEEMTWDHIGCGARWGGARVQR